MPYYFIHDTKTNNPICPGPHFYPCASQREEDARDEVKAIYGSSAEDLSGLALYSSDNFETNPNASGLNPVAMPDPDPE
jgi:hypothetical protein